MLVVLSGVLPADVHHVLPPVVRRVFTDVLHVITAHLVLDVAMVSSPQVGIGYHSVSMVDNQTHTKVSSSADAIAANQSTAELSLLGLRIYLVDNKTKHLSWFLARMMRSRAAKKKACEQPITPLDSISKLN
jgi:hypothetical protein